MTIIVNNGTTKTIDNITGLTIVTSSTIAAGGVLDGTGTVGGNFELLNQGTISADANGATLSIATGTLTNSGTVTAAGGTLAVQSGVTVSNRSGSTLTGGVWRATGTGKLDILGGAAIAVDNATIVLGGTASVLTAGGTTIDNSLATIGASGALTLANGRNFQTTDSLLVNGTVTLTNGTLSVPTNGLTIGATTGRLIGNGAIDAGTPVVDSGTIEANGGTLSVPQSGNMGGSGVLQADAGASLAMPAFGNYTQNIVNNGTIDATFAGVTGILGFTGVYSGTGQFFIQGGTDASNRTGLELPGSVAANVAFDSNFGALILDAPGSYTGTISGFGNNDTILMNGVANATKATLAGNVLSFANNGGTVVQSVTIAANSMILRLERGPAIN